MAERMWGRWEQASAVLFLSYRKHIFTFPLLRCFTWGGRAEPKGKAMALQCSPCTYHGELVGCRAVMEKDVDDVGVPLLRSLVQRRVAVLRAEGEAAVSTTHKLPPRKQRGRGGNSPSFWH